ncbi:putative Luminal-binding protein 2 [Hypsibius exemplaris]|uniref:Luminal-binding protein 2 n=1 Tax=Hypsibius exemplaris TaxID=2072580 RepID=A0A1W0WZG7_HYPEX|nr:putative Luminal-binding protein 2 [Hypsibius exemplaris]
MSAVGIDFGTANIAMAVWQDGAFRILEDTHGEARSSTFLAFKANTGGGEVEKIFAAEAIPQSTVDFGNTFFDIKQFIGRPAPRKRDVLFPTSHYRFNFSGNPGEPIGFKYSTLSARGSSIPSIYLSTLEVCKIWMHRSRELWELSHMGTNEASGADVAHPTCVVTYPYWWNETQRSVLKNSAKQTGIFPKVFLLNDPTAVLFGAFLFSLPSTIPYNVVVVDVGAKSLAATVFQTNGRTGSMEERSFHVLDCGTTRLDYLLIRHCLDQFEAQHERRFQYTAAAIHRLHLACKEAKERLLTQRSNNISVDDFTDEKDLLVVMNQKTFETFTVPYANKVVSLINHALNQAFPRGPPEDYEILLVGQASRMAAVQQGVKREFGDHVNASVLLSADRAAVHGAAAVAMILEVAPVLGRLKLSQHYRPLCEILRTHGSAEKARNDLLAYGKAQLRPSVPPKPLSLPEKSNRQSVGLGKQRTAPGIPVSNKSVHSSRMESSKSSQDMELEERPVSASSHAPSFDQRILPSHLGQNRSDTRA